MTTFISQVTVDGRGKPRIIGRRLKSSINKSLQEIQKVDAETKTIKLRNAIVNNYRDYLNENSYLRDVDDDQSINVILYERKRGGYGIKVQGDNVIYYEYGTGTRGMYSPHPDKPGRLMGYGEKGEYILQFGEYKNNHHKNKPIAPKWYPFNADGSARKMTSKMLSARTDKDLGGVKNIKFSDLVWKHHGIITKGAPAGKFIYNALKDFRTNFGEEAGMTVYKKSISMRIKKDIQEELKSVR